MQGEHDADRCYEVTANILSHTFSECEKQGVHIPGALLKPNMIFAGVENEKQISRDEVARMTIKCLMENVPHDVLYNIFPCRVSGSATSIFGEHECL